MNRIEKDTNNLLNIYTNSMVRYSNALRTAIQAINEMEILQATMEQVSKDLGDSTDQIRALKFINDSNLIIEQAQMISDSIKKRIKS